MHTAFAEQREPNELDVGNALCNMVPLASLMGEEIERLRRWAQGRARHASQSQRTEGAVEAGDYSDFLRRFGPANLPEGESLADLMGSLILIVSGYEEDPREIYVIPSVRTFYKKLREEWPYWLYFCDLDKDGVMVMLLCALESLEVVKRKGSDQSQAFYAAKQVADFIADSFSATNELYDTAGLSELQIYERTKAVFTYFQLPFDIPPPS